MKTINEIQNEITDNLLLLGDGFEQYAYLVDVSLQLPAMDEKLKTDDRLVEGCQSKVWLEMGAEGGVLQFQADSNTMIMKGVLEIIREIFEEQPLSEVANSKITVFDKTEILASFDSDRQKGIGYIIKSVQNFAIAKQ